MNIFSYFRLKHHIKRQLRLCTKYPQYRSAIYVNNPYKVSKIRLIIDSQVMRKSKYWKSSYSKMICDWRFNNRSRLTCLCTYGATYIHRLNSVIVDSDLSKEIKDSVINPTITVYQTKRKPNRKDMVKVNKYGYLAKNYWREIPIKITARDSLVITTERRG